MDAYQAEITRFYRRWHALERSLDGGGLVLDFDMADDVGPCPAFADRDDALAALGSLRAGLARETLVNGAFLDAKLDGAEAYLRALDGEVLPFDAYLRRTMGIAPEIVDPSALAAMRAELEAAFAARGIAFAPEGRQAFSARYGSVPGSEVGGPLREHAARFVARARAYVGDLPDPEYRIEVVAEDAYWSNWIDGNAADGVLLRINTHDRVEYNRFSAESLAAHEIAGHAVHVAAMRQTVRRGQADAAILNLAVHSCEAFQMEGLAQVAHVVLAEPGELHEDHVLLERHRDYVGARLNNAQIAIEGGAPVAEAVEATLRDCPLLKPLSIESSLRDRGRDPLYRSYIHVYEPARRLFLAAAALPEPARSGFFRAAWTGLYTPAQLRERLAAASA